MSTRDFIARLPTGRTSRCGRDAHYRPSLCALALLLPTVLFAASAPSTAAETLSLSPCNLPGVTGPSKCGELTVPENPERPQGRQLRIAVAVLPATGRATKDPIVPVMGGPGEAAIVEAAALATMFAPLRRDRDLLLVDQRGTGQSNALRCTLYSANDPARSLRHVFPPDKVEQCARELSTRADLTQYGYLRFADDLESVRRALGYESLNLHTGSYGTRAAQVYMRTYPMSVRTAYLGSVVPIDLATPLLFAKSAEGAMNDLLGECERDSACRKAFPNVREEFRQVIERLDSGQVRVAVPGSAEKAQLDRGRVAEWIRSRLYRPYSSTDLPWMIHRAYEDDWAPIVDGVLSNARGADSAYSLGLLFSITCSDDIPFIDEQSAARESKNTFLRDYRLREQQVACSRWPKVSVPPDYRRPIKSAVPTLFVSGADDGGTPVWMTEHAAPGFSNRIEVVQDGQGHTEWNDCLSRLYAQFVTSGSTRGLDPSCPAIPRPPFKTGAGL